MTDGMRWESPPARNQPGRGSTIWADRLEKLRARPGEWALLGEYSASMITQFRKGMTGPADIDRSDYEMTGRMSGNGNRMNVYMRYVGKPDLKQVAGG